MTKLPESTYTQLVDLYKGLTIPELALEFEQRLPSSAWNHILGDVDYVCLPPRCGVPITLVRNSGGYYGICTTTQTIIVVRAS